MVIGQSFHTSVSIHSSKVRQVTKRDGRVVNWDTSKVIRAVSLSFYDIRHKNGEENPFSNDFSHMFGLSTEDYTKAVSIARSVENLLEAKYYSHGQTPSIENIQDVVEIAIMMSGEYEVAKNYIEYRRRRSETRLNHYDQSMMSNYLMAAKYMRYLPQHNRREILKEAVDRVRSMHLKKYELSPSSTGKKLQLYHDTMTAFDHVENLKLWPSSRSMQYGGLPIELHEAKMYNCTYSPITRIEFFREYIYLLLCGCGCGFSVQWHHMAQLPEFPLRDEKVRLDVKHFRIPDTITGWGDAVHELFKSYLYGYHVEFNFSKIRPRGAPLKTSGGKAPGHMPLKIALTETEKILEQCAGRRLKPIEAYDICMHLSQAVLAGGVRRSASICLFSADDGEMMTAKTSQNYRPGTGGLNTHRSASNNSAVLLRSTVTREEFDKLFALQKDFGEPGFYFLEDIEHGTNPCVEIGLNPLLQVDASNIEETRNAIQEYESLHGTSYTVNCEPLDTIEHGDRLYGWQFCNLCSINGGKIATEQDFYDMCKSASVIGTLQAGYTHVPYIGPVSRILNEREALLGVSISGIMDSPTILLNSSVLRKGAEIVNQTNRYVAEVIGIEPAARTTCVKPDGTVAKVFGCGSGIHPHPGHRYFRRIQANRLEAPLQYLKSFNPSMVEESVYGLGTDDVITFPIEVPPYAIVSKDLNPTQFLDCVHLVMKNWVEPGMQNSEYSPGLHHNVSNTVYYRSENPQESKAIADWIWDHRFTVTGISLGAHISKVYPQAPNEVIENEAQVDRWNHLNCKPVDYQLMFETDDGTNLKENIACAGGQCEL